MNFLAPLFLLGALAVALPVIFHLIRRSVKERTLFSSLMFLHPSPPRLTRRSRLEHLLLLVLRSAVLCLLAAGFARPFLNRAGLPAQPAESAKRVLVLLDTSASMRRQGLWSAARAKAEDVARKAGPADEVALITFDQQPRSLVSFEEWNETAAGDRAALIQNRLAGANPGWTSTALDTALTEAAELFGDRAKDEFTGPRQIVVISDFQEGSRLAGLQGYQWPNGLQVIQERIIPKSPNNASLHALGDSAGLPVAADSAVRVRVNNSADSNADQFRVGWADAKEAFLGKPMEVYVPAGQSRVVTIPAPAAKAPAEHIVLTGDAEPFDNAVWMVPPAQILATVTYLGADQEGDARQPLYFLRRALLDTPRQAFRIVPFGASSPLSPDRSSGESLFVVTAEVTDPQAAQLRAALSRGSTVLMAPTTAEAAASLGKILQSDLPPAQEQKLGGYAMLADIDFGHPLFSAFADSRYSDFTKIHFWKYRKMDFSAFTNAQTLARFDTGDPAIVSISAGKGRVYVFTSGWHPADSQLALSSKFVPLLCSLAELSGTAPAALGQFVVGAPLPIVLAAASSREPVKIQLPHGSPVELKPGETNFVTAEPGIYSAVSVGGTNRFAVNLAPLESRTAPLPGDELDRLGMPGSIPSVLPRTETEKKVRLHNTELEARQKLWRWFIVAALLVVGTETWLAGWTARRAAPREEPT